MSEQNQTMEIQKEEIQNENGERTRDRACFIPRTDVYENETGIHFLMDMPGVSAGSVDITLEKNVLTIQGYSEPSPIDGYSMAYAEYEDGDFLRKFKISNEVDVDNIQATMDMGVLLLDLPKKTPAKKKITVQGQP